MNCRWYDSRVGEKASNRVRDSDKLTICNCDVMIQQGCQPNHRNRYFVWLTQTKRQQEIFSSPHKSRPALGTTQAFPTAKGTECGADHPHLSSADVKKEYSYTPKHPLCLHSMLRGDLYLTQIKQVSVVIHLLKFKQRGRLARILWQTWKEAILREIIQVILGRRYFGFFWPKPKEHLSFGMDKE